MHNWTRMGCHTKAGSAHPIIRWNYLRDQAIRMYPITFNIDLSLAGYSVIR